MFAAVPARASSLAPGCCSARSSSRSMVGKGTCAAPRVRHALPSFGAKSATTASTPSRLVPDITPAKSSAIAGSEGCPQPGGRELLGGDDLHVGQLLHHGELGGE